MTKFHRYSTRQPLGVRDDTAQRRRFVFKKPMFVRVVVGGIALAAGFGYLFAVTSVSTQGFRIKTLQTRIEDLQRDNEKLELNIAQLQSGEQIRKAAERMKLVEAANVKYLQPASSLALGQ